ncbi:MAG: methyl-accepting chemotaxis protein, partial [Acidobacteriota bacterium]
YGDFNEIKNNLNNCIDVMSGLLQETDLLIKATKEGRLDTRGKADKFAGGWGELVSGVNDLINAFVGPINVTAEYVDRISKGDIPPKITDTYYGDFNEIKNNLNNCIDVMRGLLDETGTLIKATQDGKLDTRGKADKFVGGWGELVSGVNDLIDAFVAPINVTAEYVDRISKGEIPQKITDIYKGDFNEIKNNLNNCIDGLGGLVECNHILHRMSMNDHTTGVEGQYQGLYGEMAHATNEIRDRLVGVTRQINEIAVGDTTELEALKKVGKRCEEDKLLPAVIECMDVIELLIKDTMALAAASVDGKLSTRADVSKHHGEYRKIVQGINDTLDAVIDPVQEAAAVMNEMAKGNLQIRVTGNYKGDHAQIKDALNDTIDSVKGYINEVSNVLNEMANGNLDVSIQSEFRGDFIAMKDSINMIINAFNEVMEEINTAANQVASGSNQVSDSSQSLSQASTEQAASIEEITASITEVAAQTKQNAVNANQANELALSAKENAVQGDEEMQEMLKAMSEINESSANISKIIKVIDEIAFQTNILALNAAVEAARAGQHGKGFAVVAEEVRNLAARSANAAKETTVMIEGSIQKVEQGTKIANGTAEALNKIVGGVAKAADLVGNIAIASNEQATAIAQIDQGLAQVSDVTQMNTATAEQSASASQQLASQAELLKERVARFKLRKHGAAIGGMAGVSPEILKAIRDAVARNNGPAGHHEEAKAEAAAASAAPSNGAAPKIKISLDDMEFGKY